jgi:hypothetical protein
MSLRCLVEDTRRKIGNGKHAKRWSNYRSVSLGIIMASG